MYYKRSLKLLISSFTCSAILLSTPIKADEARAYMDVGLGLSLLKAKETKVKETGGEDIYNISDTNKPFLGSLGAGFVWKKRGNWIPFYSLGLEYTFAMPSEVKGAFFESGINGSSGDYTYKISYHTLVGIAKMNVYNLAGFMPYIAGGIGLSLNQFSDYSERLSGSGRTQPLAYPDASKVSLAYQFGGGFDFAATDDLWFGLDYRYSVLGELRSDQAESAPSQAIKGKLASHGIRLTMRYLF